MTDQAPERIWAAPDARASTCGTSFWDAGTFCTIDDGGTPYIRADLAAPKVKPLVWGDHGDGKSCAYLLGLEYEVGYENGSYYWHEHRSDDFGEGFAAEDHARSAAQADCERRIFSAQEGGEV